MMSDDATLACVGLAVSVLIPLACTTGPSPTDPVATYTGGSISAAQIAARLATEPIHVQKRFNSSSLEKRAYLEGLVEADLLVAEARRRGLDREPRIRTQIEKILVGALQSKLDQEGASTEVTPEEIVKIYEAEKDRFGLPRMVRATVLIVATREEASAIHATLTDPATAAGKLLELSRVRGVRGVRQGDRGHFHASSSHIAEEIRRAAMVLPADGAVSEPVKTEDGWALVLRTAERPAVTRTMEQLRPVLEARIRMRRKGEAREQAVKKLKEAAGIVIAEGALDTVRAPEEVTRPDRGANP